MMQATAKPVANPRRDGRIVATAFLSAADRLGLTGETLAKILGVSPSSVSRLRTGDYALEPGRKDFEFAVLFVRMYRSLDAIVGGDNTVAAAWLRNQNTALNGRPIELIQTNLGLADVIRYLDSRRAPL
jgi:transcriptional regulator with XRE-family HTH domain